MSINAVPNRDSQENYCVDAVLNYDGRANNRVEAVLNRVRRANNRVDGVPNCDGLVNNCDSGENNSARRVNNCDDAVILSDWRPTIQDSAESDVSLSLLCSFPVVGYFRASFRAQRGTPQAMPGVVCGIASVFGKTLERLTFVS